MISFNEKVTSISKNFISFRCQKTHQDWLTKGNIKLEQTHYIVSKWSSYGDTFTFHYLCNYMRWNYHFDSFKLLHICKTKLYSWFSEQADYHLCQIGPILSDTFLFFFKSVSFYKFEFTCLSFLCFSAPVLVNWPSQLLFLANWSNLWWYFTS